MILIDWSSHMKTSDVFKRVHVTPNRLDSNHERMTRYRWRISGQVQGVGLRPFVYRLACGLGLSGFVRNDSHGVTLEAQGPAKLLERFSTLPDGWLSPFSGLRAGRPS